jgi:hypothetical protein
VEQLGEGRRRVGKVEAQQAPRGPVARDDRATGVGRDDAVGHRLDQRSALLALCPQVAEAGLQLAVHRVQSAGVLGNLGDARVGERGRALVGDRLCRRVEINERPGVVPAAQPGEQRREHDRRKPASATAHCTDSIWASTVARVADSRTIAMPGGPPRIATYMRFSLVDLLSRKARPLPDAIASSTSVRVA